MASAAVQTGMMLHNIESGDFFQQDDDKKKFDNVTILAMGMGTASVVLNLLAIIFYQSGAVIVAGLVAVVLAPLVVYRQVQMQNKDSMRLLQNKLRQNVNTLATENTRLCGQINDFQVQIKDLKDCEQQLADITKDQEMNADQLVHLVKENGQINHEILEAIKARAIQDVVNTFLDSDRDESSQLDDKEIKMLLFRLSRLDGVSINEEVFLQKMNQDSSMAGILAMLQMSIKDHVEDENKVFTFDNFPLQ